MQSNALLHRFAGVTAAGWLASILQAASFEELFAQAHPSMIPVDIRNTTYRFTSGIDVASTTNVPGLHDTGPWLNQGWTVSLVSLARVRD